MYKLQYTGAWGITTEFNRWDRSKLHMNSLQGNQSLPPSITQCAWYWLTPKTLTSQLTAAASEWVNVVVCQPPLFVHTFFLYLTFLVSVWAVMDLGLWIPARPTVVHYMLPFGLATCWGSLCLCSTDKHLYCCSCNFAITTQLRKTVTEETKQVEEAQMMTAHWTLWLYFIQRGVELTD